MNRLFLFLGSVLLLISLGFFLTPFQTYLALTLFIVGALVLSLGLSRIFSRKRLSGLVIFALFAFISLFVITLGQMALAADTMPKEVDVLIILGAGLWGERPSPILQERIDYAKEYLAVHTPSYVILSGGQGPDEDISEAEAMKRYLQDDLTKVKVILEDASTSTYENLRFSIEDLQDQEKKTLGLTLGVISNDFHLRRIKELGKQQGLALDVFPASTPENVRVTYWCREVYALTYYRLRSMIGGH